MNGWFKVQERIVTGSGTLLAIVYWSASGMASMATDAASNQGKADTPASSRPSSQEVLQTEIQKLSYSLGMNMAKALKIEGMSIDVNVMAQAMNDVLSGRETLLTEQQAREVALTWQKKRMLQQQQRMKEQATANKKAGDAFLTQNKTKEGVVVLPSGLQYKVIAPGSGPTPRASDTVKVHYRGLLVDGTEFDSSYKRGKPATFRVGGMIKGWVEALQLMPVGAKWQLVVPPELAYGERGYSPKIGPNATLLFDVELLSIEPPSTAPATGGTVRSTTRPRATR